jgi:hypothetical protein
MLTILYEQFNLSLADAAFSAVAYHHAEPPFSCLPSCFSAEIAALSGADYLRG